MVQRDLKRREDALLKQFTHARTYDFTLAYGKDSKNFMTPKIMGYKIVPGGTIELSAGEGIGGGRIYGLSVSSKMGERLNDLSAGGFHTIAEVEEHLATILKTLEPTEGE